MEFSGRQFRSLEPDQSQENRLQDVLRILRISRMLYAAR
jgi:hypothetical protein